ncbi:unnamed protein product (macronuclear) [Paramecium tetraurelia]|uniref:Kinesin-like protein n=1 Tax=Paramecium tetraurelia TaxID=5888 RepID=A0CVA6_PARTE|nr:uncharacterized protein GSPATT00010891001 [Paramecium tetraurelia]CAK74723.1 unnamed protein product [Paramecium tetraurelia]|eukprot:XP_001442120.1 hypothetical protein (macronuclear) [Paramecium tetraurelia strain d4-2]
MNKSKSPNQRDIPSDNSKVRIAVRVRPTLNSESEEDFVQMIDDNTIKVTRIGNSLRMKFSDILPKTANQQDVQRLVSESIKSFIQGINNTIFAYGQTGAGKTYTIMGGLPENVANVSTEKFHQVIRCNERGILPRAIQSIISQLQSQIEEDQCRLYLSFYEIYNEKIFDLFNLKSQGLDIRENKNGDVNIPDLSQIRIMDIDTAYEYLILGLRNRVVGCSHANSKSSRSHCCFQMTLQQVSVINGEPVLQESSLKIVDLAGSEKFKIPTDLTPEEKELHIQELTSINGSLSCLGHCISALIDRNRTHIPFRNSKLTRVLSDSLSGSGKILFIVCVSPSISSSAETFSTLQFANRAKRAVLDGRNIQQPKTNKPKGVSMEEYQELLKQYQKEKQLREELEVIVQKRNQGELLQQISKLKQQNQELQEQLYQVQQQQQQQQSQQHININYQQQQQQQSSYQQQHQQQQQQYSPLFSDNKKSLAVNSNDKKVRFADDFLTAHINNMDREDSQVFENLAIFQELKQLENKDKKKIINFEEKFKSYFGQSEYQTNDLAQFNTGKQFDSIIRKVNDKQNNISNIVQDLKKEMSKAVNQLEQLQKEDRDLKSADSCKENFIQY